MEDVLSAKNEFAKFVLRVDTNLQVAQDTEISKNHEEYIIVQRYSDESYICFYAKEDEFERRIDFEVGNHTDNLPEETYKLFLERKKGSLDVFHKDSNWLRKRRLREELIQLGARINIRKEYKGILESKFLK